jgi:hypothetical protein
MSDYEGRVGIIWRALPFRSRNTLAMGKKLKIPPGTQADDYDDEIAGNNIQIRIGRDRYEKIRTQDYPRIRAAMVSQGWAMPGCPPHSRVFKPKGSGNYRYWFRVGDKSYPGLTRKKTEKEAQDFLWEVWERTLSKLGGEPDHLEQVREATTATKPSRQTDKHPEGASSGAGGRGVKKTHLKIKEIARAIGIHERTVRSMEWG